MKRKITVAAAGVVILLAVIGLYILHAGKVSAPDTASSTLSGNSQVKTAPPTGNLEPYAMGFAPYLYVPRGGTSMAEYGSATGAKHFFVAFVLGSAATDNAGCTPLWDGDAALGLQSIRSKDVLKDIQAVKAKGAKVAISFGGQKGVELASSCSDPTKLEAAYQSVIDHFGVREINFDLEGDESTGETDPTAMTRRVQAAYALEIANPGLKVSLTLPVGTTGLEADGIATVKKFHDAKVTLSDIHIMAMNFGKAPTVAPATPPANPGDPVPAPPTPATEASKVISASKGTVTQLKQIYPSLSAAELYQALGVVIMVGQNDVATEIFTLADAHTVHDFVAQNNIGTISLWSAGRDVACDTVAVLSTRCSAVAQQDNEYGTTLAAGFTR